MKARYPDIEGYVERDGVKVHYSAYGRGEPAILLMPTWPIVHSEMWKAQIPYLARRFRVVTFDARGNGRSDRPTDAEAYADEEFVADAVQVMQETATPRALVVGLCAGVSWSLQLAAAHPEMVDGLVAVAPGVPFLSPPHPHRVKYDFDAVLDTEEGWAKENRHYWLKDYRGYLEFFIDQLLPEPHSTKHWEDAVGWGLETTAQTLLTLGDAPPALTSREEAEDLCRRVRCPVLVVHGDRDQCQPPDRAHRLAELTGAKLVTFEGAGHLPQGRHPVRFNLLVRSFIESVTPPSRTSPRPPQERWTSARSRRRQILYLSSPIGLGHARRDIAIAQELRRLNPDVAIDWLAQHPVTDALEAEGERIHPASSYLANESAHIEDESAEHDLHAFQAIRKMDEILVANFMLFQDVVSEERYDLWIADEGWEVDYFLHENPELKNAALVWLTDFVGWLPMPDGGRGEALLTADYHAEMLEHIARFPRVRDLSLFVGNPDDIVPDRFGPDLPSIREWTEEQFDFTGYITGFRPDALPERQALRAELGYSDDEKVCIVTVGGSGVGADLLARVVGAYDETKSQIPELRMVVVAGPRIDPSAFRPREGLEVRGYVHGLYRHLSACDFAIVHGGLTTGMELTANKRPFLYFPLRHHFEQNFHVRHRLERHRAGRCMDFDRSTPEEIADAMQAEMRREVDYEDVEPDGAARAAQLISELL